MPKINWSSRVFALDHHLTIRMAAEIPDSPGPSRTGGAMVDDDSEEVEAEHEADVLGAEA